MSPHTASEQPKLSVVVTAYNREKYIEPSSGRREDHPLAHMSHRSGESLE
jgi:hypothetical protein